MYKLKSISLTLALSLLFVSCKKVKFNYSSDAKPTLNVSGSGRITLILEAGMGNWSLFYKKLIPLLEPNYKVITTNRAGYSNSLVPNNTRDAVTMAKELHEMLVQENLLSDSIVLVGHSFGGCVVREYQHLYPNKIKGMVLLDASHPEQFTRLPSKFNQLKQDQIKGMEKVTKTAQRGLLKTKQGKKRIPTFSLPEDLLEDYYSITTNPQYYATFAKEASNFDASLDHLYYLPKINSLPLLVLASEVSMDETTLPGNSSYPFSEHNQQWLILQNELAQLSQKSMFASTNQANHYLAVFQPQWVSEKINSFINTKVRQ